jgi:hypothetical protein
MSQIGTRYNVISSNCQLFIQRLLLRIQASPFPSGRKPLPDFGTLLYVTSGAGSGIFPLLVILYALELFTECFFALGALYAPRLIGLLADNMENDWLLGAIGIVAYTRLNWAMEKRDTPFACMIRLRDGTSIYSLRDGVVWLFILLDTSIDCKLKMGLDVLKAIVKCVLRIIFSIVRFVFFIILSIILGLTFVCFSMSYLFRRLVDTQNDLRSDYLNTQVSARNFLFRFSNYRSVCLLTSLLIRSLYFVIWVFYAHRDVYLGHFVKFCMVIVASHSGANLRNDPLIKGSRRVKSAPGAVRLINRVFYLFQLLLLFVIHFSTLACKFFRLYALHSDLLASESKKNWTLIWMVCVYLKAPFKLFSLALFLLSISDYRYCLA